MSSEFKYIVRLMGRDLDGTRYVAHALTQIKGVGTRLADIIVKQSGLRHDIRLGFIKEAELRKIEETLTNLGEISIPKWLYNRQKDLQSGKNIHLISSDLDLALKDDIKNMISLKSWKGYRHSYGLKVRGQRTRTTNRKGRSKSGVKKRRGR